MSTESQTETDRHTGGCLCGAVRYEYWGQSLYAGYCFCGDCRKASGSGFIPFIGVPAERFRATGKTLQYGSPSASGRTAVRNSCPTCGSLVYGGETGAEQFTIYAGTLDDASAFAPKAAIFTKGKPDWAVIPEGMVQFEGAPG